MQIYEPLFLVLAGAFALSFFVFLAAGRRALHRPTAKEQASGLPQILLAFAEVTMAIALARRALEPNLPTVPTLMLSSFSLGLIAAAVIVWIVQCRVNNGQSGSIIPASSQG